MIAVPQRCLPSGGLGVLTQRDTSPDPFRTKQRPVVPATGLYTPDRHHAMFDLVQLHSDQRSQLSIAVILDKHLSGPLGVSVRVQPEVGNSHGDGLPSGRLWHEHDGGGHD